MEHKEIIVVLAYDYEGYIITGICDDEDMITSDMLNNGLLKTKAVKVKVNYPISEDLLELDDIL